MKEQLPDLEVSPGAPSSAGDDGSVRCLNSFKGSRHRKFTAPDRQSLPNKPA